MPVYSVHGLKPTDRTPSPEADRFVFVRDGFHVWAFLAPLLWLLWHRLWLSFLGYVAVTIVMQLALSYLGVTPMVRLGATFLIALLMGFEAVSLRRWSLSRGKWQQLGLVVANNVDEAEQRFFDHRNMRGEHSYDVHSVDRGAHPPTRSRTSPSFPSVHKPDSGIIGLFPQPGASR